MWLKLKQEGEQGLEITAGLHEETNVDKANQTEHQAIRKLEYKIALLLRRKNTEDKLSTMEH
jgi:hypothetical protein